MLSIVDHGGGWAPDESTYGQPWGEPWQVQVVGQDWYPMYVEAKMARIGPYKLENKLSPLYGIIVGLKH